MRCRGTVSRAGAAPTGAPALHRLTDYLKGKTRQRLYNTNQPPLLGRFEWSCQGSVTTEPPFSTLTLLTCEALQVLGQHP